MFRPVPPDADFVTLEEEELARWRRHLVFERSVGRREGSEPWVFYEGPPTANGRPGLHHVWARVYKDLFCRYRTMRGFLVARRAGWDTHGLPVEVEVEKQLGITGKRQIEEEVGIAEFTRLCRESVRDYVDDWQTLTERIGYWVDLDAAYWTFDPDYVQSVWWHLKHLFDQGLLYEDLKVVPYCPRCGTALSSHELGPARRLRRRGGRVGLRAAAPWRTPTPRWWATPPTLRGVDHHPLDAAVQHRGRRPPRPRLRRGRRASWWPSRLVEAVFGEGRPDHPPRPGAPPGRRSATAAPSTTVAVPPRGGRVAGGDRRLRRPPRRAPASCTWPRPSARSTARSAASTACPPSTRSAPTAGSPRRPGGCPGERCARPTTTSTTGWRPTGCCSGASPTSTPTPTAGGAGPPLIYWGKPSWYVATSTRKADLLSANQAVDWHPAYIRDGRFGEWLENNVDWALSRDRYWGTPLPIWRCDDGHVFCVGSLAELSELAGRDVRDVDPHRPAIDEVEFPCPECAMVAAASSAAGAATGDVASALTVPAARRVEPVIDAWFDSGSMPAAQVGYPWAPGSEEAFAFPADFITEAIDQTRGWFYSLLAVNTLVFGRAPYRHVMCLGHIVDADGRKMSKSVGNVIDPWEILGTRGADPLRWWMFSQGSPWTPTRVSLAVIDASMRETLLTLWNTLSFFTTYASLNGFDPDDPAVPDAADRPALDRWALSRVGSTVARVTEALDAYEPLEAATALAELVDDLSNWYVRRSRRRFWRTDPDAPPADSLAAQATLHQALVTVSVLLAPFCPFLADRMWRELTGAAEDDSVHLADWPERSAGEAPADRRAAAAAGWGAAVDPDLEAQMALARRLTSLGRAARGEAGVRVRQPLARALVFLPPGAPPLLGGVVEDELNVDEVVVDRGAGGGPPVRAGAQLQGARTPPGRGGEGGAGRPGQGGRGGGRRLARVRGLGGRRPVGRAGRALPGRGGAAGAGAGRVRGLAGGGRGRRPRPVASTTTCAGAGWPARWSATSRTCARRAASRCPTASASTWSGRTRWRRWSGPSPGRCWPPRSSSAPGTVRGRRSSSTGSKGPAPGWSGSEGRGSPAGGSPGLARPADRPVAPQLAEGGLEGFLVGGVERGHQVAPEAVEVLDRRPAEHLAPLRGEPDVDGPPVGGAAGAFDVAGLGDPVHQTGDPPRGERDLGGQPAHGQVALGGPAQPDEHVVPGEGEAAAGLELGPERPGEAGVRLDEQPHQGEPLVVDQFPQGRVGVRRHGYSIPAGVAFV